MTADQRSEAAAYLERQQERARRQAAGLCQECGLHPASVDWVGDGGALAYVHGFYERWCRCCATRVQLERAREQAARIPELERELAQTCPAS